jgi:NAD(P)-dependent dehydrogenase (short-subunit alcohol dehydrogenase family)
MSKTLVIGAAGLLGSRVVEALGEDRCIRASRNAGERVDISDPKSIAALFGRVGQLDGIVCTGGAARFKPWDQMTDEDWAFSLANKLLGQVNVVRYGAKSVRPGGAITLTTVLRHSSLLPGALSSPRSMPRSRLLSAA